MKYEICLIIKKFFLFCSSYSLLFILIIILKWYPNTFTFYHWLLIGGIIISIIIGNVYINCIINNPSTGNFDVEIQSVENKNNLMHAYLLPYIVFILSFINNTPLNLQQTVAIAIFIIILFIIYCKSDLFSLDITLIARGYSYYKVTSKNNELIIITKNNLYSKKGRKIKTKRIDDNVVIYQE